MQTLKCNWRFCLLSGVWLNYLHLSKKKCNGSYRKLGKNFIHSSLNLNRYTVDCEPFCFRQLPECQVLKPVPRTPRAFYVWAEYYCALRVRHFLEWFSCVVEWLPVCLIATTMNVWHTLKTLILVKILVNVVMVFSWHYVRNNENWAVLRLLTATSNCSELWIIQSFYAEQDLHG